MTYYEILRVNRRASMSSIKASYRDMARTHHPDKGGDTEVFKKINEAYTILSDETKRKAYDFNELSVMDLFDPDYAKPFYASDPISNIHSLIVSLSDICTGVDLQVQVSRIIVNERQLRQCTHCNGTGVLHLVQQLSGLTPPIHERCAHCTTGYAPESISTYTSNDQVVCCVPKGCPSGMLFCFPGMGNQSPGTRAGDLIIRVEYDASDHFYVPSHTLDLVHTMEITLYESLTGFTRPLQHPDGRTLRVCNRGIIRPGVYTVIDQGIDFASHGRRGHLFIHIRITYPSQSHTLSTVLLHPTPDAILSLPGDIVLDIDIVRTLVVR